MAKASSMFALYVLAATGMKEVAFVHTKLLVSLPTNEQRVFAFAVVTLL